MSMRGRKERCGLMKWKKSERGNKQTQYCRTNASKKTQGPPVAVFCFSLKNNFVIKLCYLRSSPTEPAKLNSESSLHLGHMSRWKWITSLLAKRFVCTVCNLSQTNLLHTSSSFPSNDRRSAWSSSFRTLYSFLICEFLQRMQTVRIS